MNSGEEFSGHRPPLQHEPRFKRLDQLFTRHPLYFVTACTEGRRAILANATVHQSFREFCAAGLERGVFVGRYVLMPDHVHLFVAFGEGYESALSRRRDSRPPVAAVYDRRHSPLSVWVKSLKNTLSKTLRGMNVPSPHWQKGFFDHVMRSEESYSEKWLYVAQNPVRGQLVTSSEAWPYQGEVYPLMAQGRD